MIDHFVFEEPRFLGLVVALRRVVVRPYAIALGLDTGATLDDVNEAVTTLEDTERVARRVFGGAHPFLAELVSADRLRKIRAALRARETPSGEV